MKKNKLSKVLYTANLAVIDQKKHWIVQINDKSMKLMALRLTFSDIRPIQINFWRPEQRMSGIC